MTAIWPEPTIVTSALSGADPAAVALRATIRRVARRDGTVLLIGSALEPIARSIHAASPRARGPFFAANGQTLAHGDLAIGLSRASGGMLFLDDVDALTMPLQARLASLLDGLQTELPYDLGPVLIAGTRRNLSTLLRLGRFNNDLYFRIAACPVRVSSPVSAAPERVSPEALPPPELTGPCDLDAIIAATERAYILSALDRASGVVAEAARLLGLRRTTLIDRIKRHRITRAELAATERRPIAA